MEMNTNKTSKTNEQTGVNMDVRILRFRASRILCRIVRRVQN